MTGCLGSHTCYYLLILTVVYFYTNLSRFKKSHARIKRRECLHASLDRDTVQQEYFSIIYFRLTETCLHSLTLRCILKSYQQVKNESQTLWCSLQCIFKHVPSELRILQLLTSSCMEAKQAINYPGRLEFSVPAYAFIIVQSKGFSPYIHMHISTNTWTKFSFRRVTHGYNTNPIGCNTWSYLSWWHHELLHVSSH